MEKEKEKFRSESQKKHVPSLNSIFCLFLNVTHHDHANGLALVPGPS
jgi:hypothetical protein